MTTASVSQAGFSSPAVQRVPVRRLAWVTWRQHRWALAGAVALLAICAAVLIAERLAMTSQWTHLGLNRCTAVEIGGNASPGPCFGASAAFANTSYYASDIVDGLNLVPLLIGLFAGAPFLAREYENGTLAYTCSQGIKPARWIAGKLLFASAVLAVVGLAVGQAFTWWYPMAALTMGSADRAPGGWSAPVFDLFTLPFAGWTVFGFIWGVLIGALARRIVPAMAAFTSSYAAIAFAFTWQVRAWLLSVAPVTVSQHYVFNAAYQVLPATDSPTGPYVLRQWFASGHYWISSQPHARLVIFQLVTAVVLLILAALAAMAVTRSLRRPVSRLCAADSQPDADRLHSPMVPHMFDQHLE